MQLFLKKNARIGRLPDYVVIEGPLAGGHLGFGMDWAKYDLHTIVAEIRAWLKAEQLDIPLIPAGGIFTGGDAVDFLDGGGAAVQVATRFTVARECGLPEDVQQKYFKASEDDIEVNGISPTGYPMRMLKNSPAIGAGTRPNCESFGYLLDANGRCAYVDAYNREVAPASRRQENLGPGQDLPVHPHAQLRAAGPAAITPTGSRTPRVAIADGSYQLLSAEHIFNDYRFSKGNVIALPAEAA